MSAMLKKTLLVLLVGIALMPRPAAAQMTPQPPMPMVVDLKKVVIGTSASYSMTMGEMTMSTKFALVARDASSVTMETTMEGGVMAMLGGKMTMKMVMDPDPTTAAKPIKQMIMQVGDQDPMLAPDTMQTQKYSKPDPSTLVGKETIKVPAGSFKTSHYRSKTEQGTVDVWVSEDAPPTGLVKLAMSGLQVAPGVQGMVMELTAQGKGAKSIITKPPKPFDPQKMMGGAAPPQGGKRKAK
jgi:hypothetical protein